MKTGLGSGSNTFDKVCGVRVACMWCALCVCVGRYVSVLLILETMVLFSKHD